MDAVIFVCALISCSVAFICAIATSSIIKRLNNLESDLLDCASRGRNTYLELNTLANKVNKPAKKAGRPKKKLDPLKDPISSKKKKATKNKKIVHQLNGEQ